MNARTRHHSARRPTKGFTLLELLVVIGILVLVMGLGISSLSGLSGTRLRTQTNKLAAALRYTYNRSVTHGLYMRMVIDIEADAYWVEASAEPQFLSKDKLSEGDDPQVLEAERVRELLESQMRAMGIGDDAAAPATNRRAKFEADGVIKKVTMERGIGIAGVMTSGQTEVFETGKAFIHFFPNGFVEPALIYTTDGDDVYYTLMVHPLTGKVKLKSGKVDPERSFGQPERVEEERN